MTGISGFIFSKKGYYKATISSSVNSPDVKLKFPMTIFASLFKKEYGVISQIRFEYIPVIQDSNYGQLQITMNDNRKISVVEKPIFRVTLCLFKYQSFAATGFEWTALATSSPWSISFATTINGLAQGTQVGKLKIIPTFRFMNGFPQKDPFTMYDFCENSEVKIKEDPRATDTPGYYPKYTTFLKGYTLGEVIDGLSANDPKIDN